MDAYDPSTRTSRCSHPSFAGARDIVVARRILEKGSWRAVRPKRVSGNKHVESDFRAEIWAFCVRAASNRADRLHFEILRRDVERRWLVLAEAPVKFRDQQRRAAETNCCQVAQTPAATEHRRVALGSPPFAMHGFVSLSLCLLGAAGTRCFPRAWCDGGAPSPTFICSAGSPVHSAADGRVGVQP